MASGAVAVALLLAGCSTGDVDGRLVAETSGPPAAPPSASPSSPDAQDLDVWPPADPDATTAPRDDQELVDRLGMRSSDFASGYSVQEASLSSSLDVATLDHCGATYPSEADRTARRATVLFGPDGGRMGVLSQAVAYPSAEAAARALDELAAAVEACADGTPVRLAGVDAVVRVETPGDVPTAGLVPAQDRVLVGVRYESGDGTVVLRTLALWQRQGRAVVELLLTHTDQSFTSDDLARLGGLGGKIAGHLARQADWLT